VPAGNEAAGFTSLARPASATAVTGNTTADASAERTWRFCPPIANAMSNISSLSLLRVQPSGGVARCRVAMSVWDREYPATCGHPAQPFGLTVGRGPPGAAEPSRWRRGPCHHAGLLLLERAGPSHRHVVRDAETS
jgi:hypothetical protein